VREILEMCVELDRIARDTYALMAATCTSDEDLNSVFTNMSTEEGHHVQWWSDLIVAWESGLVPDIVDEHDLLERLREIKSEVHDSIPSDVSVLSVDQMLDVAARMEFFMLDPVFGELTELMRPGGRVDAREAYSRHVLRIVDAIERRHTEKGLASFLARVLQRSYRDQQRLAALAMLDQLTSLYNRRGFLGHLNQWLSWSARYGRPVALVLIDVDHFKTINDTLGHPAGDEALVAVAAAINEAVRRSDIVGRFGGDEFVVLAPETDSEELILLMERINIAVGQRPLVAGGEPVILSVSVGGSWVSGGIEVSAEAITAMADSSLYEAKASGRNRTGTPLQAGPASVL